MTSSMSAVLRCLMLLYVVNKINCFVDIDVNDCTLRCGDGKRDSDDDVGGFANLGKTEAAEIRQLLLESRQKQQFCPQTSYVFPRRSTADYIRVKAPMAPIDELTICTWATIYGSGTFWATIVSYSTVSNNNNFLILFDYRGRQKLYIQALGEIKSDIDHPLTKGPEHFICFAIDRSAGYIKAYYNGTMNRRISFQNTNPIPSGGAFLIGQEQDSYLGSFEANQAIHGEIQNYMMWERVLTDSEISRMFQSKCNCPRNYSLALTKGNIQLEGGVNALYKDQRCH